MQEGDILWVKECQAGDLSAFGKLVEQHRKRIYRLAYHITGSHEAAEDISQESFIRAYRSLSRFQGKSLFSTWLQKIAINLSINHLKKESHHKHEIFNDEGPYHETPVPIYQWEMNPLKCIEAKELDQRIKEAINSLPLAERVVFTLRVQQELSYQEIAQTLSCPIGTVMSRLNRARMKLRDKLKDYVI